MKEREICMIERRKKVQGFIDFVQNLGIVGIFIATAIEAAIPFPNFPLRYRFCLLARCCSSSI